MDEYVHREDAIKCIEGQCVDGKMWGNDESEGTLIEAYSAIDDLMEIPFADVAPVRHGRWVKHPTFNYKICSVCSGGTPCDIYGSEWLSRHCPSCGAKMDGELKEGAGEE